MRYIVLIFKKESEESSELDFYYKIGDDDNHNPRYYNSSKFSVEYPSDAVEAYDDWIEEYNALLGTTDRNGIKDKKKKVRSLFGNSNTKLNEWFSRIKIESQTLQQIIENELEKTSKLRLIIETKQEELQKLFWHQLEILKNEHKQKVGVVFTIPDLHPKTISPTNTNNQSTLKILIIFGVNPEHNPREHSGKWEQWKTEVEKQYNPGPSSKKLAIKIEESPQEYHSLLSMVTQNDYHIVYFTGHGTSPSVEWSEDGATIKLCEHTITVDQFYNLLSPSHNANQQLVILNCCEGLTVAKNLLEKGVLQVLCIREKIELEDSKKFLEKFLSELLEAGDTHIAHHQTQLYLSLANNADSFYGSCSITALFHQARTVPPILPPPTTSYPPILPPPTTSSTLIKKIKELLRRVVVIGVSVSVCLIMPIIWSVGYSSGFRDKGLLDDNDKQIIEGRIKDSLEYTVDVYNSKKQRFTGTFVDKSENDSISTSHKKYTYKVILPKDIEDNQKLTIKTNKETVQGDDITIEYDQDAFPEGYDKFLMVSFQSDEEYSFPEIETQVLKEFLSSSNTYLPLVEETRIIIYRKEPNSPSLFQPELGVLIAKEEPEDRSTNKDKKFLYYGYAKNSGLVKLLQDNLIQIEIHTFENEQFKNKNELTQLPETSNVSRGFNLDYSSDKQYIFFSFSTDENYQCFKMNQKITSLPDLAKNYHKYLPFLKSSK
jgi:hypothetical protein